jgi:hypothetical protein
VCCSNDSPQRAHVLTAITELLGFDRGGATGRGFDGFAAR